MGRRLGSFLLLFFFLAETAPALAQDSAARLDFGSPDGCPQLPDFTREVESRLARGRLARPGEMARTFHVRVKSEPEKSVAKLTFTDVDGRIAEREVSAATCDEATRAIAIVTALAMDVRAEEEAAKLGKQPEIVPPPAPTTPVPPPSTPPRQEPPPGEPLVFGIGAEGGVERGFAPGFAPRVAALFEIGQEGWVARLGLSYADSGPVAADGGKARYRLYSARATFWPLRLEPAEEFGIAFGGGFDLGAEHGRGEKSDRIDLPDSTTKLWFSPTLGGRLELSPDPALAVHVEALAGFPVTRHEFELERNRLIHDVPAVTASVGIGLVARFE